MLTEKTPLEHQEETPLENGFDCSRIETYFYIGFIFGFEFMPSLEMAQNQISPFAPIALQRVGVAAL